MKITTTEKTFSRSFSMFFSWLVLSKSFQYLLFWKFSYIKKSILLFGRKQNGFQKKVNCILWIRNGWCEVFSWHVKGVEINGCVVATPRKIKLSELNVAQSYNMLLLRLLNKVKVKTTCLILWKFVVVNITVLCMMESWSLHKKYKITVYL